MPDYEEFKKEGCFVFVKNEYQIAFCRHIEEGVPFQTPSGKIELFSKRLYEMEEDGIPGIPYYTPCEEGAEDPMRENIRFF